MTEIRVDLDFDHPPDRLWRALTEAHLITDWLSTSRFVVTDEGHFSVHPVAVNGLEDQIDGQIVSVERPHRIVMRWEAPNLHTLVTVTLRETETGCRLTLLQRGFLGPQGTMRRRVLQRSYTQLLAGPLAESLNRLAAVQPVSGVPSSPRSRRPRNRPAKPPIVAFAPPRSASAPGLTSTIGPPVSERPAPPVPRVPHKLTSAHRTLPDPALFEDTVPIAAVPPPPRSVGVAEADDHSVPSTEDLDVGPSLIERLRAWIAARRTAPPPDRRQAVAGAAAVLLLFAMFGLLFQRSTQERPPDPPQIGGAPRVPIEATLPGAPPSPTGTRASTGPSGAVTASPRVPAASVLPPTTGSLSAVYQIERDRVSGYDASITITNRGGRPVVEWSVILTLPLLDLAVHDVENAQFRKAGKEVTFTPLPATRTLAAGASLRIRFQVEGLGPPTGCTIGGQPCTGLATRQPE
jgi:uncharacterized protein YndB with AHSA1/START domain